MPIPTRHLISRFATETQEHVFADFADFARWFTAVQPTDTPKERTPAWSPQLRTDDGRKKGPALTHVTVAVLDFDDLSNEQIETLSTTLNEKGWTWAWHTSYRHGVPLEDGTTKNKLRIAIELQEPVPAEEWPGFWWGLYDITHRLADSACTAPSHIYQSPFCDRRSPHTGGLTQGRPLDPAEIPRKKRARVQMAPEDYPYRALTRRDLKALHTQWKRKANPPPSLPTLGNILATDPFVPLATVNRDKALYGLGKDLWREMKGWLPQELAELAKASIHMADPSGAEWNVGTVAEKLQHAIEDAEDEEYQARAERDEAQQAAEDQAMAQLGREGPYTRRELERWAGWQGCSVESFKRRLVVIHGGEHYVWFSGRYLAPVKRENLGLYLRQYLAPAQDFYDLQFMVLTKTGAKFAQPEDVLAQCSTTVNTVALSMTEVHSRLQDPTTFVLSACPLRPLEPERQPEVERWLDQAVSDPAQRERLLDWLACVPAIDKPIAMLYLHGAPSRGKSLLAEGVARLWTTQGATKAEHMVRSFNGGILDTGPLLLADECLPPQLTDTRNGTGTLRGLITDKNMLINRKNKQEVRLKGHPRYVVTANSLSLFDNIPDTLSTFDLEALDERLLYVAMDGPPRTREQVNGFIEQDMIARHVLHLQQTRPVVHGRRLCVEGADSPLHRQIRISGEVKSLVLSFLCHKITTEAQAKARPSMGGLLPTGGWDVTPEGFWITAAEVKEGLAKHENAARNTTSAEISRALVELSAGTRGNLKLIHTPNLIHWLQATEYIEVPELTNALEMLLAVKGEKSLTAGGQS